MEKFHIIVESTNCTIIHITRDVVGLREAIDCSFEESATGIKKIIVIDLEHLK